MHSPSRRRLCSLEMKNSAPRSIVLVTAASKTLHVHIEVTRLSSVDGRHRFFVIVNPEKLPQFLYTLLLALHQMVFDLLTPIITGPVSAELKN